MKIILSIIIIFYGFCSVGQSIDSLSKLIPGTWVLTKHEITIGTKKTDHLTSNYNYFFEFFNDGTFKIHYEDKTYGNAVNTGKWKLTSNGKTIIFYQNKGQFPGNIMDHERTILKLSSNEFVFEEYLFIDDPIGTSYYNKK